METYEIYTKPNNFLWRQTS